ncbi:hypothetical protein HN587_03070 [Candidatus Woesearchaeota archaeon]|jgi:hypothetical protein|nr:hypothetical protein [Candidatus Woesearchaeota archaeon]
MKFLDFFNFKKTVFSNQVSYDSVINFLQKLPDNYIVCAYRIYSQNMGDKIRSSNPLRISEIVELNAAPERGRYVSIDCKMYYSAGKIFTDFNLKTSCEPIESLSRVKLYACSGMRIYCAKPV